MKKHKISLNAPVVLGFAGLCLLATVLGMLSDGRLTQLLFMTYHSSLANPMTWLRFFTHVLGHASWAHFMGNTMYLLLLAPLLEEKYGSCHPCVNTSSLRMRTKDVFEVFVPHTGHEMTVVRLDGRQ